MPAQSIAHFRTQLIGRLSGMGLSLAIALLLPAEDARADFADCAAPGFLGGVDDRMRGVALPCDEFTRFTIETPEGPRDVRIIYSTHDTYPDLLGFVTDIQRGIERAADALMQIGEGAPGPITVWASNLASEESDSGGDTQAAAYPVDEADGECVLAIYEASSAAHAPYVAAHEFFHCVQFATVGRKALRAASAWWVEGTAEWFASRTYQGTGRSDGDVLEFDRVSPDFPLTAMEQEAVVFFFWLDQAFGANMAMSLMRAMPESGGADAEQNALAGFLPPEDFQRFAEAYLDREIAQPGGRTIPSNPFEGGIHAWSESRTHELTADRLILARFKLEFDCGGWSIERRDERGTWHVSLDNEPWRDMPPRLAVPAPGPDTYRVAAFGTDPDGFHVTIEATRNACMQCEESTADEAVMACLIGRWELVSGGYGEQIQRMLELSGQFESIEYPDMESVLVIARDGGFEYPGPPEEYNATVRSEGGDLFQGIGTLSMASKGLWSIDGDKLQMCEEPHRAAIDLTLIDPDGTLDRLTPTGGPDSGVIRRIRRFACAGDALTLVETGAMTWEYRRAD